MKIIELARTMIELSGLVPDEDVAIEIVGRPAGEKVHEALFAPHEQAAATDAERILRADRPAIAAETVDEAFGRIKQLVREGDAAGLADEVSRLISAARGDGAPPTPTPA